MAPSCSDPRSPSSEPHSTEWVALPGGELEVERPKKLCARCRTVPGTLCFECHRSALDRERHLKAAAVLETGSAARFQELLPFEAVDHGRLEMLKVSRVAAREEARKQEPFAHRRRQAQLAARHALQQAMKGLSNRQAVASAIRAAELQLPESWIPFVVGQ